MLGRPWKRLMWAGTLSDSKAGHVQYFCYSQRDENKDDNRVSPSPNTFSAFSPVNSLG